MVGKESWAIGTGIAGAAYLAYLGNEDPALEIDPIPIVAIAVPTITAIQYVIGCGIEIVNTEIKKTIK